MSDEIRQMHTERPFRPFRIRMNEGSIHEARHPEILMAARRTV